MRFKVISDKLINVSNTAQQVFTVKKYIKFKKFHGRVMYNALGTVAADITSGSLWIYIQSDSTTATHPSFGYYARVNFQDL
jgi:hypothetical protein